MTIRRWNAAATIFATISDPVQVQQVRLASYFWCAKSSYIVHYCRSTRNFRSILFSTRPPCSTHVLDLTHSVAALMEFSAFWFNQVSPDSLADALQCLDVNLTVRWWFHRQARSAQAAQYLLSIQLDFLKSDASTFTPRAVSAFMYYHHNCCFCKQVYGVALFCLTRQLHTCLTDVLWIAQFDCNPQRNHLEVEIRRKQIKLILNAHKFTGPEPVESIALNNSL